MKLSNWAKKQGISYRTAWNLYKNNQIANSFQLESGTIIVQDCIPQQKQYVVVYARVSSSENKKNLDTQAQRVAAFCNAKGWEVSEIIKECASGLNDNRPKLQKILTNSKTTHIVVEHKDRLTRFGFNYLKTLYHGEIIVINEIVESEKDLMQDFVSLVTSFCARIYGKRRSKRKTEQIIQELTEK